MKSCRPSGTRPVKIPTTQAAITANQTTIPHSEQQEEVGDDEQEAEEDGEPVASQVVGDDEVDRVGGGLVQEGNRRGAARTSGAPSREGRAPLRRR